MLSYLTMREWWVIGSTCICDGAAGEKMACRCAMPKMATYVVARDAFTNRPYQLKRCQIVMGNAPLGAPMGCACCSLWYSAFVEYRKQAAAPMANA